jgi:hypothetical protein
MGPRIPSALAGEDNEVTADQEGLRKVLELVSGAALGAGILAGGAMLYRQVASAAGANESVTDLY